MIPPEPEQPAINAPGRFMAQAKMGAPVSATYWGLPGDAWRKVVDEYVVVGGKLVVRRSVEERRS